LLLACTFYDGLKADTGHKYNNNNKTESTSFKGMKNIQPHNFSNYRLTLIFF
jgi:hypothetical protein